MFRISANRIMAAAVSIALFSSCEKDDDPSRKEMLTSGQWRLTAATANPPLSVNGLPPISDVYTFLPACYKDNYYVFNGDGTAEINEGPQKCDPAAPQSATVNWTLSANEQELTLAGNTLTILEITSNRLRVKGPVTVQNLTANAELTFTK